MRIDLGDIKISNGLSIIDARKKLYKLVVMLTSNSLLASRLSAVVSQSCKNILSKNKSLSLSISLDTENSGRSSFNLSLISTESIEGRYFDNSVFEYIRPEILIDDKYCKEVSLRINAVQRASKDLVWRLQDIVNKKSRDELIDEIKDTNIELKESLENLKRTTSAKERMESELNIGRDIQMSMLPLEFPPFPDRKEIDILAALHPAREVGGDFYDFFFIDDTRLCFCIGDVSGKGVPAALFMAMTKTLIKSRATDDLSTASIITHINDELSEDNKSSMFVTVYICILNTETGELIFTNAGHNPPFIKRKNGSIMKLDDLHGPVVGAIFGMTYKEGRMNLESGDHVLLYTDGVTEAMDTSGSLYSENRLVKLLEAFPVTSLELLLNEITSDVKAFEGEAEQADDITLIAVSYHGGKKSKMESREVIVVKNNLSEIETVNNKFADYAKEHNVADAVTHVFGIVFDDILNNIISYAYEDTDEHEIEIHIHFNDDRINVSISDDGKPFNPLGLNPPDTSASLEDRAIGGLGIHLVRKMMDDIQYQRKIDKNVLSMTKMIQSNNG